MVFLSLVQAPTLKIFEQRLKFIMSVFAQVNTKTPGLSDIANADLYLPFFTLAHFLIKSDLHSHQFVKPNLPIIRDMTSRHNAIEITKYTNRIRGKNKLPLDAMRMEMTTHLALGAATSEIVSDINSEMTAIREAKESIARGNFISHYFKPMHQLSSAGLSEMTLEARNLFCAQSSVKKASEGISLSTMNNMMSSAFAYHKQNEAIAKQLQILASASLSECPRVFYKNILGHVVGYEGLEALDYIHRQLCRLLVDISKYCTNNLHYLSAATQWCTDILFRVEALKLLHQPSSIKKSKSLREPNHEKMMSESAKSLPNVGLFSSQDKLPVVVRTKRGLSLGSNDRAPRLENIGPTGDFGYRSSLV